MSDNEKPKRLISIKSMPYNGRYGFKYRPFSIVECDADEAAELVREGIADYHDHTIDARNEIELKPNPITVEEMAQAVLDETKGEKEGEPKQDHKEDQKAEKKKK